MYIWIELMNRLIDKKIIKVIAIILFIIEVLLMYLIIKNNLTTDIIKP